MDTSRQFDPLEPELEFLIRRMSDELVKYTPEHFGHIYCELAADSSSSDQMLFYKIWCPDYPEQATTNPSPELHDAASCFVDKLEATLGFFPGFLFECRNTDGSWQCNATRLDLGDLPGTEFSTDEAPEPTKVPWWARLFGA